MDEIKEMIAFADTNNDGTITSDEFKAGMRNAGLRWGDAEMRELVNERQIRARPAALARWRHQPLESRV